ncbi:MAG: hypothetical protein ACRDQ5_02005 [Sciscionella sp.]
MRRALEPYENSIAGFNARLENRSAEFAAKLAEYQRAAAERDARQLAALAAVRREQKQEQQRPQAAAAWSAGPDPSSLMDFGPEGE